MSADAFLGVPFNIASYALLTHMIADMTGLAVGEFVHTFGDLHIYSNHTSQVMTQLNRTPKELPTLAIKRDMMRKEITDFDFEDFTLIGYNPDSAIPAKVSVGK
jgi:thymidylate synthase